MEEEKSFVRKKKGINMYKELIISMIILISIISLNYITQKNTDDTVEIVSKNLEIVRKDVLEENPDKDKAVSHANEAYDKWEELDDTMAYYIEHDELEKVKTALTSMKSFVEVEEYAQSVEAIDKCIYILEHIHERELVTLDNIF